MNATPFPPSTNRLAGLLLPMLALAAAVHADDAADRRARAQQFAQGFGTYDAAPRAADGRVDIPRLLRELADLRARSYSWLIWHGAHDWDDLQAFLPRARAQNIRVWVTLVPPSESPPRTKMFSEPFRLDFTKWAQELATLSLREPNLVGWSIDDFVQNTKDLTAARMGEAIAAARAINPRFAFFPCCYFSRTTPAFVRDFGPLIDGIFFPYRNESIKADLKDAGQAAAEVRVLRERLGPDRAIVLMVYATAHSRLGASTAAYVDAVMQAGRSAADGVIVYCHQNPQSQAEKYAVLRRLFHGWAMQGPPP
jgi:hypothetical protein